MGERVRPMLREAVAIAIAEHRGGAGAGRMAEELLRRDTAGNQLVGVLAGAEAAVYWRRVMRGIVTVPFDERGVDGLQETGERADEHTRSVERYVGERGAHDWAWVHPRYRWVLE